MTRRRRAEPGHEGRIGGGPVRGTAVGQVEQVEAAQAEQLAGHAPVVLHGAHAVAVAGGVLGDDEPVEGAALVVAAAARWWAPVFAVLISLWIVLGGWAAGLLIPNFRSDDAGTVAGNVVMTIGLAVALELLEVRDVLEHRRVLDAGLAVEPRAHVERTLEVTGALLAHLDAGGHA